MSAEENPYAAPQAPALTKADPREGALWYVSEGVLHVRDGASLPDVCLSGAAPGEPGERTSLDISWCPAWIQYLPSLGFVPFLIWGFMLLDGQSNFPGNSALVAMAVVMIALIWLVRGLSKRCRFHMFRSHQAKRSERWREWIEGLIVVAVILGVCFLVPDNLSGSVGFLGGAAGFFIGSLRRWRQLKCCGYESGWFALANVHPAAIARLEEIQGRLVEPALSRKPS